mgnify:FL=1
MKTILLKSIEIKNFKGIKELAIDFTHRVEIYGRNGLGKTSILDSFLWCLFGKDSSGSSSFSVRPLNPDGTIKEHHDVDVHCILSIDGADKSLRRRWVEKVDKNGKYKGNEGAYYVDNVPVKEVDYKAVIADICKEDLFTLITSTGAFNRMKDADRRAVLAGMADSFDEIEMAKDFPHVLEALRSGKSLDIFKSEVKSGRTRADVELNQYPTRLKENADSRPTLPDDIALYPTKKMELEASISTLDTQLHGDDNAAYKSSLRVEIDRLSSDKYQIEDSKKRARLEKYTTIYDDITRKESQISSYKREQDQVYSSIDWYEREIKVQEEVLQELVSEWEMVNNKTFDANADTECPMCKRPFSQQDIELRRNELIESFNQEKVYLRNAVDERGKLAAEGIDKLRSSLENARIRLEAIKSELATLTDEVSNRRKELDAIPSLELILQSDKEYVNVCSTLEKKQAQLRGLELPTDDQEKVLEKRRELEVQLKDVDNKLSMLKQIEMLDKRKAELEEGQKQAGELVAHYKMLEDEILGYSMKRTDYIEQNISSKFRLVQFKMFEYNLSNDNVREVCICTVNGVPYKDLNTAMKYNADIDIINALSAHYSILAPIFIDRAESINVIEDTQSQRIDLYATKEDTVLRIEKFN